MHVPDNELPQALRGRRFASPLDRRRFVQTMGLGGLFFAQRGAFAQALVETPAQTIGPYYPDRMPLDLDNDLLLINDAITPAVGEITWITGRVLDRNGQPVRNALVEIWQADINGAYIHTQSTIRNRDANFQGYGRFVTSSSGQYLFRTVKPGLYPGRTCHVHYGVTAPGRERFITQLYVEGQAQNASDGVLNGIRDAAQRQSVIRPWTAVAGSKLGELAVTFDLVLGFTPSETPVAARPALVSMAGVVHGASLNAGAAPGAWITLFGTGLADTSRTWGAGDIVAGKLPETLDGVSVRVNNKQAAVYYVSPRQLNVLTPSDVATGTVQVTVSNAAGTSDPVNVEVKKLMPGFFQLAQEHVAAARPDGSYVAPAGLIDGLATTPARPGESILLFGTGFGETTPGVASNATFQGAAALANQVTIRIDNRTAEVAFAGLVSPGLYQFNVTVPAELEDGDHAVWAEIGGERTGKIGRLRTQRTTVGAGAVPGAASGPAQSPARWFAGLQRHFQA